MSSLQAFVLLVGTVLFVFTNNPVLADVIHYQPESQNRDDLNHGNNDINVVHMKKEDLGHTTDDINADSTVIPDETDDFLGQTEAPDVVEPQTDSKDPVEMCKDEVNWGEMSTCSNEANMSISWCPKFIRNNTIYSNMYFRINWAHTSVTIDNEADLSVVAYIPGFHPPIYNNTFAKKTCKDTLDKLTQHLSEQAKIVLKTLGIKCPLTPISIPSTFPPPDNWKMGKITNPLGTIVPAGSYHLLANIHALPEKKLFMCLDGWLEFGL